MVQHGTYFKLHDLHASRLVVGDMVLQQTMPSRSALAAESAWASAANTR